PANVSSPSLTSQPDRASTAVVGAPQQASVGKAEGGRSGSEYIATPNSTFRSITSYREMTQSQFDNGSVATSMQRPTSVTSFQNFAFGRYSSAPFRQNQFSQELQVIGEVPRSKYQAGGLYYQERVEDSAQAPNTSMFTNAAGTAYTICDQASVSSCRYVTQRASHVTELKPHDDAVQYCFRVFGIPHPYHAASNDTSLALLVRRDKSKGPVVTHHSFRRAAAESNVSQPPLTRQIQQLEEILGVRSLERNSRGITLTAAGESFYADARNILASVDQGATRANAIGQGQMGRIDVGVFGSAIFDVIPRIVSAFREQFPDVEVSLHTMSREEQVKALIERRIDVGFNRFFNDYPGLFWQTIASQRMLAAIPTEHPLAARASLSLSDLNQQPIIFYPPIERPGGFSNFSLRMLHERSVSVHIAQNVEDVITAISLVSSGLGIALGVDSVRNLNIPGVT
ncbi:hypothetical protein OY671_007652, partial [Metschnikowia pulcherrima]